MRHAVKWAHDKAAEGEHHRALTRTLPPSLPSSPLLMRRKKKNSMPPHTRTLASSPHASSHLKFNFADAKRPVLLPGALALGNVLAAAAMMSIALAATLSVAPLLLPGTLKIDTANTVCHGSSAGSLTCLQTFLYNTTVSHANEYEQTYSGPFCLQ